MAESYKIQVKFGDAEFLAEGPEEAVKSAFEQFLRAREAVPVAHVVPPEKQSTNVEKPETPPAPEDGIEQPLLDRVFQKDDDLISLRMLPRKDNNPNWQGDSVILLLYGFRRLANMPEVPVTKLNQGLRKSGVSVERVNQLIEDHSDLYMKGGVRSGGRYTLNNQGVATAERWLKEQFN
ncbi:MAG: hypothetical protein ACLQGV_21260 [Bryobacteraceae bacterium]